MAEEKKVELAQSNSGISLKVIIIIAVFIIVLMAISIGITIFFLSGNSEKDSSAKSDHSNLDESTIVTKPAIYFLLKPDFVINFESDGKANFLSVQIEVMAREKSSINIIETHMPVLRNNVLLLLSAQKYQVVSTLEGKDELRKGIEEIIKEIINEENKNLKKKKGEDFHKIPDIEAVYFTGFIMQ